MDTPRNGIREPTTIREAFADLLDLLRYCEELRQPAGGRFLPPFTTEYGFLLLRCLGGLFTLFSELSYRVVGASVGIQLAALYLTVHLAAFLVKRLVVKREQRQQTGQSEKHYWTVDTLQLLLDMAFATVATAGTPSVGSTGILLFLTPVLQISYRSLAWNVWIWMAADTMGLATGALVWPMLGGRQFDQAAGSAAHPFAVVTALFEVSMLVLLSLALRLNRNLQMKAYALAQRLNRGSKCGTTLLRSLGRPTTRPWLALWPPTGRRAKTASLPDPLRRFARQREGIWPHRGPWNVNGHPRAGLPHYSRSTLISIHENHLKADPRHG